MLLRHLFDGELVYDDKGHSRLCVRDLSISATRKRNAGSFARSSASTSCPSPHKRSCADTQPQGFLQPPTRVASGL